MNQHLRKELLAQDGITNEKKLWENTYIKHQLDRRTAGEAFTVNDHICAMVYSMLSAGIRWDKVSDGIDMATGRITPVDTVFHGYNADDLLQCDPAELRDSLKEIGCASQSTLKQMTALVQTNIPRLLKLQTNYGSTDLFYQKFIDIDPSMKTLVTILSYNESEYKFVQMNAALIAEYLKNVGYDIAKPDRHICRILGSEYLACSDKKTVPIYEAFDIVSAIAKELNKSAAEVDYILWSYCANGYGEICTLNKPKCDICAVTHCCENFRSEKHETN